ncbi:hypothetical protein RU639_009024 [Aspergillus parasiticus]
MKTFLALGALAALCQSAFSLEEGRYTIASVSLPTNPALTDLLPDTPLTFLPSLGLQTQTWTFENADAEGDFYIQSANGGNLNCGTNEGSFCESEGAPEVFTVELVGDNTYRLVSKGSGYYLSVVGNLLQLATDDTSPKEQFVLSPVQRELSYPTVS